MEEGYEGESMNTFNEFLESLGLKPSQVNADGRWRRCPTKGHPKKRNGSYKLDPSGTIGWAQDWSTMDHPAMWKAGGQKAEPVRINRQEMLENHRAAMAERENAIAKAREFYRQCQPLRGGHPYLERQGLDMTGCFGVRVDREGWIVVPAFNGGKMVSYQRIAPDGTKRFAPGCPIHGSSYTIERRASFVTVVTEGWATGLAIFAALQDARVVVAWSAGNLPQDYPTIRGWRVVAGDNDHGTEEARGFNPGIQAAQKAAELLKCGLAYPEGIRGTDWADYRRERFEALRPLAGRHETEAGTRRKVDAEIRQRLMAEARFA
jgi:putative DNA primase/helicase